MVVDEIQRDVIKVFITFNPGIFLFSIESVSAIRISIFLFTFCLFVGRREGGE